MNLQTVVFLSLIFNLSINAIQAVGIVPNGTGSGLVSTVSNIQTPVLSLGQVQTSAQCSQSGLTLTCNPLVQVAEAFWATALTFGIFLWGVINVLPVLAAAILIPGQFLGAIGVDPSIVAIYSYAFTFLYLMWAYTLWTGRYNSEVS